MGNYDAWKAEIVTPLAPERRGDRPVDPSHLCGFWRMEGARTKPDYPVAIWAAEGHAGTIFQIGRQMPRNTEVNAEEWDQFASSGLLKCIAVLRSDWNIALESGFWPSDNKHSRQMSEAEKLGVGPSGDNAAPADEAIIDQLDAARDASSKITVVTNADDARKANEMAERLAGLFKLGDAERDKQKRPHDEASKAVQAFWLPHLKPVETERLRVIGLAKKWIADEQAKLAAQQPADVPAPRVQAASTFGRALSLRKVPVAFVDDPMKLCAHLIDIKDDDLRDYLHKRAQAALRGKVVLPGCSSKDEMQ